MKKNLVLSVGFLLTVFSLVLFFFANDIKYSYCGYDDWGCWDLYNLVTIILLLGPALLISSLVVYRVSEDIFLKWKKFTLFSIFVYLFIITFMPWEVGDEIAGFTKGMAGLVLSILYLVVSLTYIFFLSRKNK